MKLRHLIPIIAIATTDLCSASPSGREGLIAEAMVNSQLVSIFTKTKLCDIDPKISKALKQHWQKVSKLEFNKIINHALLKKTMGYGIHRKDKPVINISYYYGVGACIEIKGKETTYLIAKK